MNLAAEILYATSASKYKDWVPGSTINAREKQERISKDRKPNTQTRDNLIALKAAMGTKVWTVSKLSENTRIGQTTVRDRLAMLVRDGEVMRSKNGQPSKFWILSK